MPFSLGPLRRFLPPCGPTPRAARLCPLGLLLVLWCLCATAPVRAAELTGRVVDADTGHPLPARVYLRTAAGEDLFVESARAEGSAFRYEEQWVPLEGSSDRHTTVSAHPWRVDLPAGEITVEIERGKEYRPLREVFTAGDQPLQKTWRLQRWVNASARGWYSGETHVHRRLVELPNVMLAEDLNVAFPVTFWTVTSKDAPNLLPSPLRRQGLSPFGPREDRGTDPIRVDNSHVIVPRNTEYEIFNVNGKPHTLGAMFVLNHRSAFTALAPPVSPIARQAHAEGALLDLDKHNWPWSLMLVPVAKIDLFELSNNSVWRTKFGFRQAPAQLPDWLRVEQDSPTTFTEWGWLNHGWKHWYALLNCGFEIAPTAGTASGVHPVPLGHSRVYVHTGEQFDLESWWQGLKGGRSFVTTGPMLFATLANQLPGERFEVPTGPHEFELNIETISEQPVSALEVLVGGEVVARTVPDLECTSTGAWRGTWRPRVSVPESTWVAVRSVEPRDGGRRRFAHTASWYIRVGGKAPRPRRQEVQYFVEQVSAELERNRGILSAEALTEFEQARDVYRALLERAR
ncbi:MAG: CehA/McbA family metallohydrolase [Planctomycetaceae bacterium]